MTAIASVMTRSVYAVAPDTSIETAARLLASQRISGAPVVDPGGRPVGVISLTDLADPDRPRTGRDGYPLFYHLVEGDRTEIGDDVALSEGQVADIMSPFVLSIDAAASLQQAATLMLAEGVHRLLVMDGSRLVGIVTTTDLLRGFIGAYR
jgi:CBS domain-containing protein